MTGERPGIGADGAANGLSVDTLLTHDEGLPFSAAVPPIVQSSLFTFDSYQAMDDRFHDRSRRHIYSRGDNPTVQAFEEKVRLAEGGEAARAVSSGMGAISAAVLAHVAAGDRIVCVRDVYPDAYRLFEKLCRRLGIGTDYVDGGDPDAVAAALPGARLLYLESPTSLTFDTQDLARLTALARAHGVTTIADNSWATPLLQRPLAHGVDIVVHSASKYLSGHSDTVAGIIVTDSAHMARIATLTYPVLGPKLSPFEGWLLLRGLRTLSLRMARHQQSAALIAERLRRHPNVTRVRLAGPATSPTLSGHSGLFAFEVDASVDVPAFCDALGLFRLGVSWGGHESLVYPARIGVGLTEEPANSLIAFGVSDRLIRLSVGLEGVDDLWADLAQALSAAAARPPDARSAVPHNDEAAKPPSNQEAAKPPGQHPVNEGGVDR